MADFILERIAANSDQPALFWRGQAYDGAWLVNQIARDLELLRTEGVGAGSVVILQGDYSPQNVALLLALVQLRTIIAPLLPSSLAKNPALTELVNPSFHIDGTGEAGARIVRAAQAEIHPLIATLQQRGEPGLILFTSGSTGKPKGVVHDFGRLLTKFQKPRPAML